MEQSLTIKSWAEEDRPREKLLAKGRHALSDSELIAILIGSGNNEETAVDLSKRILRAGNNNLNELGKLSVNDLKQFKGIGEAKAISIIAALELGRRRQSSEALEKPKLLSSKDSFHFAQQFLADLPHEKFLLICLNTRNQILHHEILSSGGVSGTVVDLRMVLKIAIEKLASGIIVAHNHPSGNVRPSLEDDKLTKQLKEAAKLMNILLQDHLIIGNGTYFSFADERKL
ncbi:MAG TPA: DNA repair protein RadC [Chitinophagales bacterium]